jgi:ABC-type transporter Mla subunit MlaD
MSLANQKALWITLTVTAILIAAISWLLFLTEPFTLMILFDDVGKLQQGDPVLWRDFEVGEVEEVLPLVENQIGVRIKIGNEYVSEVTRGTSFTLRRATLLGLMGQNAIVIETPEIPGSPFEKNERIQGVSEPVESLLDQGREVSARYWEKIKAETGNLMKELQSSPHREEAREALNQLMELAGDGARQAKEELERFRRDHADEIDQILKKLDSIGRRMLDEGDEIGAQLLREQIERVRKNPPENP